MLCMIYVDLESLIKEIDEWKKDPKKFTTIKTIENIECIQLDGIENKHNVYKQYIYLGSEDKSIYYSCVFIEKKESKRSGTDLHTSKGLFNKWFTLQNSVKSKNLHWWFSLVILPCRAAL